MAGAGAGGDDGSIPATSHAALEIACDESGWEGTNLVTGGSDVIAYASVGLDAAAATECLDELRGRVGHRSIEFKASRLLRADHRPTVSWLLGPGGPLHGNAQVHLTDKAYFVVGRVLDLFLGGSADLASAGLREDERLRGLALALHRQGPAAFGGERWLAFLTAASTVLRHRRPRHVREPVDAFLDLVGTLSGIDGELGAVLAQLRRARSQAYAARAELLADRMVRPALEPLIPALARTVRYWCRDGHTVSVVHDEQSALTVRRIEWLAGLVAGLRQFRQVDSRTDPRVQVVDLLAGIARRVASDALHARGDPWLRALVRPYLDPASRWSDEPSWHRLAAAPAAVDLPPGERGTLAGWQLRTPGTAR